MNGRAFAPPCSPVSTGVSTSRKPREISVDRTDWTTAERVSASCRARGLTIRSTYRCLTRDSGSVSPACFSGSGRSDLAVIAKESASTESSPDREVITSPVTPTWSPRSTSRFHAASASSPTLASEIITWMSPVPSRSVAKQSLPPIRERITRPATPTVSPVAVSGGSEPCAARSAPIVVVRG